MTREIAIKKKIVNSFKILILLRLVGLFNFYQLKGIIMLNWVFLFLIVAIIAGVLGFTGIAAQATGIAKLLFIIFLILFVLSLVMHLFRGNGK